MKMCKSANAEIMLFSIQYKIIRITFSTIQIFCLLVSLRLTRYYKATIAYAQGQEVKFVYWNCFGQKPYKHFRMNWKLLSYPYQSRVVSYQLPAIIDASMKSKKWCNVLSITHHYILNNSKLNCAIPVAERKQLM